MYPLEFTPPSRRIMRLIADRQDYSEAYIEGLMYIHDLICDMPVHAELREFTPEEIHGAMGQLLRPDVYMSYSSRDRLDVALKFADDLRGQGVNVWMALPGTGLPDNWDAPLSDAACFVAVISPLATESQWIRQEWAKALDKPTIAYFLDLSDPEYLPDVLRNAEFFGPKLNWSFQGMIAYLQERRSADRLPFEISDNLRQNYDAARRIWFLGDTERFANFYPAEVRAALTEGKLDVEALATRFINSLVRTYTVLLHTGLETDRYEDESKPER